MTRRPSALSRLSYIFSISLLVAAAASGGCKFLKRTASAPTPAAPVIPVKAGPVAPKIDYAAIRPNELGHIPVIMYHDIGTKRPKDPLERTPEAFRKDLELLYDAGFRPVNMSDVVNNRIDVPAGKSPVVLTFDDARASQFQLTETDKDLKIAPDCALGILEAFHRTHSDWPMRATFFVLPKSRVTQEPFGQADMGGQKLAYLIAQGMELGNHTVLHKSLRDMSPAQIQAEVGGANNALLEAAPNAKIEVMAVPMGKFPRNKANWQYLRKGTFEGKSYDYQAVLDAAWQPMLSPADKKYDPARLSRIEGSDRPSGIRDWLKRMSGVGSSRYVSDGDPNVISFPKGNESHVNLARLKSQNKLANAYAPFGGPGGAKPIVADGEPASTAASPAPATATATNKPIVSSGG